MSWRSLQLKQNACAQDQVVFSLFKDKSVKYIGTDLEFAERLTIDPDSENLMLILNKPLWLSEFIDTVRKHLIPGKYKTFYIGVNRYYIIGNDTDLKFSNALPSGLQILELINKISTEKGYSVKEQQYFDDDKGRYMNFVQPVTWAYGTQTDNI